MRTRSWLTLVPVGLLSSVVGCLERTAVAPSAEGSPPPVTSSARSLAGAEGYRGAAEVRTGWIRNRAGRPMRVTYEVRGTDAVWEGDIVIGRVGEIPASEQELRMTERSRGVVIDGSGYRWTNGVVPYEVDPGLPNQDRVTNAVKHVNETTNGVFLRPRVAGDGDYIRFVEDDGCSSPVGKQGGENTIKLATGCGTGSTAHEILHSLGVYHEHTRCDRDGFVTINLSNVESGKEHNFTKKCDDASDIGTYDRGSIMHYGPYAFAVDNAIRTITAIDGVYTGMGQRDALSASDIATVNELYGANNDAPTAVLEVLAGPKVEGSGVGFKGDASSDPDDPTLTYAWTFGDGGTSTAKNPNHIYADNGSYTVELTVSDGYASHAVQTTVAIGNVAPQVFAGPDASRKEAEGFIRGGNFTDPGADSWTATVDYGDGSGVQALPLSGKTFVLSHAYVDNGVYTITVTVTDDDAGADDDPVVMTVTNVNPVVAPLADATVTSGETFNFSGTFSDPGVIDFPWTWTLAWGFGLNTTGSTNDQSAAITASRQVCTAGSYTVTLSVTDKDAGTGARSMTLTVPYFAIGIDISPTQSPNPVSLSNRGLLPVAILSTATFDARQVDPSTVTLGNETGSDTQVARQNNGRWQSKIEDANGDGRPDMIVMVEVPALVRNGDLTASSTQLVLRGYANGCTNFRGVDAVRPQ